MTSREQSKLTAYRELVAARKACHLCAGLTNQAEVEGGVYDSEHIGAWSQWQGNLDAPLMVVGQDWGDAGFFMKGKGREGPGNPTNLALIELLGIAGVAIGPPHSDEGRHVAFFTNAILCLKGARGGLQGKVEKVWFKNCASFLRRQIETIRPVVVVGLGERAYQAILLGFGIKATARHGSFRSEVEDDKGTVLPNGSRAFAMYHCGARIQNTHRRIDVQREDWKRLLPFLDGTNARLASGSEVA